MTEPGPPRELQVDATLDQMTCVLKGRDEYLDWSGTGLAGLGFAVALGGMVPLSSGDWGGAVALLMVGGAMAWPLLTNVWKVFVRPLPRVRVTVDQRAITAGRTAVPLAEVTGVDNVDGVIEVRGRDGVVLELDATAMARESRAWLLARLREAASHGRDRARLPREAREDLASVQRLRGEASERE